MCFGPAVQGWTRGQARARGHELLGLVHLAGYERRKVHTLSGGERQRVALARALAPRPRLLLLDEPLSALDAKLRQAMRQEIQAVQRELGVTTLYVTHDQEEALAISDRIAVVREGRLEQVGTPEEVYHRPRSLFVAGFIGQANLVPGTVAARDRAGRPAGHAPGSVSTSGPTRTGRPPPPGSGKCWCSAPRPCGGWANPRSGGWRPATRSAGAWCAASSWAPRPRPKWRRAGCG